MKYRTIHLILILQLIIFSCQAQFKNNIWCFGDSSGIRFDQGATQLFTSSTVTRGSSCSISDSSGNLLFYANTFYYPLWLQGNMRLGVVFDKFHDLMQNGDTLVGLGAFQEQVIVPNPSITNLFYLFTTSLFPPTGFYYSVIDLNQNFGLGSVVQKNVQLKDVTASDGVSAIKHGNGRDWWVLFRRCNNINNSTIKYLITPNGIDSSVQNIGSGTNNNFTHTVFNSDGSKYLVIDYRGLIEIFDFDRCTGILSNPITIEPELPSAPYPQYSGCAFSKGGRYLYINNSDNPTTYLYQFDLQAANITASKILIDSVQAPSYFGFLRLAPDNKIYSAQNFYDGINTYPYTDSLNNNFNQYLSVINNPDSAGTACDFSPFSFYLGGNETYWGLPNNPDYDLGPLIGSGCDTLTSLPPTSTNPLPTTLHVTWASNWQKAFVNASNLKGHKWRLEVYDLLGNRVYIDNGTLSPPYFSRGIELPGIAGGMYVVRLETEKEVLSGKFIVED